MFVLPRRVAAFAVICATLAGCVQTRGPEGPVPVGITPVAAQSAYSGAIGAVVIPGGGATIPAWAGDLSDGTFAAALENALRQGGIMAPGGPLTLEATVLDIAQGPAEPSSTKVVLSTAYRLVDGTGRARLERRVTSGYTATLAQAVQGIERLRLARQGAMRENIAVILRELGSGTGAAF
ncbi:MAG: hypothetical protein JXJ18_04180 [Rhodobacteraceae bacterium]|nr:hypothetical protein [Paracoccaceae bacterium]